MQISIHPSIDSQRFTSLFNDDLSLKFLEYCFHILPIHLPAQHGMSERRHMSNLFSQMQHTLHEQISLIMQMLIRRRHTMSKYGSEYIICYVYIILIITRIMYARKTIVSLFNTSCQSMTLSIIAFKTLLLFELFCFEKLFQIEVVDT